MQRPGDGPISGADKLLINFATRLRGAGVNVSLLFMHAQAGDAYHGRPRRAGVPVTAIAEGTAAKAMRAGRARYEAVYSPQAVLPLLLETHQRLRGRAESVSQLPRGHLAQARARVESIPSWPLGPRWRRPEL